MILDVSHQRFADNLRLPYYLVADEQGTLRDLYGVPSAFMFLPGRVTYVIDREGIVRLVFNSSLQASQHTTERALRILREIKA
ncbi:MAG: redoxin domain-containing protein [Planctomycetales bacterium]